MAKFSVKFEKEVVGFTEQVLGLADPAAIKKTLDAGAAVIVDELQKAARNAGFVKSGTLVDSIAPTKPKNNSGAWEVTIYPQGVHHVGKITGHKNRNAEIGFVLNYGRGYPKIEASNWADSTINAVQEKAYAAMQDAFNSLIKE